MIRKDDKSGCPLQPNRPKRFRKIGDKIALETSDTPSLKDISDLVKEIESKTDPGKLAEEKIKQRARERRRKDAIRKTLRDKLKPQKFEARSYSPDADAFDTKYLDGSNRSFWGFPITNGIIQYGDIVRGFHAPSEVYGLIDAMPKGRDFILPKPIPIVPVKKGEKVYPCTVAFLYSKIKSVQEVLTDSSPTDITSYDYSDQLVYNGAIANGFRQRFDDMGDYATAADALSNNIKESRKTRPKAPGTGDTGAADNAAWSSGTADAITVWYYIGNPANAFVNGKIFKVSGTPTHPSAGSVTSSGPGVCMEVYSNGFISSAIWPNETFGIGPLTKKLKESFPELGGKIGYAGDISTWHGIDDYATGANVVYRRTAPGSGESVITPSSYPSWWTTANGLPWNMTGGNFYQFGWTNAPMYFGCASSSWVNVNKSGINSVACAGLVANSQWYWGGFPTTPSQGTIDKNGVNAYIGIQGMYVCWQGHKDHAGMAREFFEAFRTYWGIPGEVTYLGAANPYGCGGSAPDGGGSYPPAPIGPQRFLIEALGRKAEIWLKVCRQEDPPIELKLPFEFVAVVEKLRILGGAKFGSVGNPAAQITEKFVIETIGTQLGFRDGTCDLVHATLNIDANYAYVDILFGVEREFENPLSRAIPCKLLNLGAGAPTGFTWYRSAANKQGYSVDEWVGNTTQEFLPRVIKDSFSYCQSYKIKLPTKDDKTLTIEASQKYKRPEPITLTANTPDNEFNQKYLICDFRTQRYEDIPHPLYPSNLNTKAPWQNPQPYFASFGGLPALIQGIGVQGGATVQTERYMVYEAQFFYKSQTDWTQLDHIHYELMERPERFWKADTTFPPNVTCAWNGDIKFNLDGKFQRQGRAERMCAPNPFGYSPASLGSYSIDQYNAGMIYAKYNFPLALSFKEQLIGNGVIENGKIRQWYRITTSSFPLLGQMERNVSL